MTKEQAIEILEGMKKSNEVRIKNSTIKDTHFVTFWKRQNEAIEKVLSMLEKKDKKISSKDRLIVISTIEQNENEKELDKLKEQLKEKDKTIDLMAEQLAGLTIFDIDKNETLILGNKEETEQYFENKAKEVRKNGRDKEEIKRNIRRFEKHKMGS